MGKPILGAGIEVRFLQRSSWGEVGNSFDAFWLGEWMDQNDKELKREKENMDPLQTDENMENQTNVKAEHNNLWILP